MAFKSILVPLDGSELAEKVLPKAEELAKMTGASVHLVSVISRSPELEAVYGTGFEPVQTAEIARDQARQLIQTRIEQARQYLDRVASRLRSAGVQQVETAVLEGAADEQVVDYARKRGVDLIAMTTRGHGGLRRLFLGSVTDRVIRSGDIPVLVWHPEK